MCCILLFQYIHSLSEMQLIFQVLLIFLLQLGASLVEMCNCL